MSKIIIPAADYSVALKFVNSRFIASIGPASSVAEAKSFISSVKKEYRDATHNVPVYMIGSGSTVLSHCSDDGEPSGTAGRPALSVLSGSGLCDAALVITRYFGGTKLGTGGLVKAYSEAARIVIKEVKKAHKIFTHQVRIISTYDYYELITRLIRKNSGLIENEVFTEKVELLVSIPVEIFDEFEVSIMELTNGKIKPELIAKNLIKRIPIQVGQE
jgi:uncharacterized YigZ family protein